MEVPIPGATSRWISRPLNYKLSDHQTDPDKFNVLLYIGNVSKDNVSEAVNREIDNLQDIGVDFDALAQPTLLKGNLAAGQLLYDYDYTITFARNVVDNFELYDPPGTAPSVDWIGPRMMLDFGEGWTGQPIPLREGGTRFQKRSKREIFIRAMDLAGLGWQIRVSFSSPITSYMSRHIGLMERAWDISLHIPWQSRTRSTFINHRTHSPDILGDSVLTEITGDIFKDINANENPTRRHDRLHETAYSISNEKLVQMRHVLEQRVCHPDILILYQWCIEYMDRFHLWRDAVLMYLKPSSRHRNAKTLRWTLTAHEAYLELIRHLLVLHAEVWEEGTISRIAWRNLYFCVEGVTALVRWNKFNPTLNELDNTYAGTYGPIEKFPNREAEGVSDSIPIVGFGAAKPEFGPMANPAPGEPGGLHALGGPGQPGGPGGLGGVGGVLGPGGPPQPANWYEWTQPDSRALRRSRVKKRFYARWGQDLFRIERISGFHDKNDAAFVKRALQQELEQRDKFSEAATAVRDWDGMGDAWSDDEFDDDDDDTYKSDKSDVPALPIEIDSVDERRRQLDGFKAELEHNWSQAERAAVLIGHGELADFDAEILPMSEEPGIDLGKGGRLRTRQKRFPEFSPNAERDQPHAKQVRMNHILSLDESEIIFGNTHAY
ncbi:hypothetical protein F4803DRAFT_569025 [Xylaria telfairii]|nr:hypothetical protein F4803DRAFT_569025 [Xylaria telfairii]